MSQAEFTADDTAEPHRPRVAANPMAYRAACAGPASIQQH
jgi:hypothetical protein